MNRARSQPFAGRGYFHWRPACGRSLPSRHHESKVMFESLHGLLHRSTGRGGHSAGMPVESQKAAERLKPKWVRQPPKDLFRSIFTDDMTQDFSSEPNH